MYPQRSNWIIDEVNKGQPENASIKNDQNEVISTKTSIEIREDQPGIDSETKLQHTYVSSILHGLIIGALTAGLALAVVTSLWLTSTTITTQTSTVTTVTPTTSTSATTTSVTTTTAPPFMLCSTNTSAANLSSNQFIYSPTNQLYAAGMLNNQFGVYNAYGYNNVTSTAIWTANQSSTPAGAYFSAQNDRNLVVYGSTAIWASHTSIHGLTAAFCLQMLDSRNLIWTNSTSSIIWQSNSAVATG